MYRDIFISYLIQLPVFADVSILNTCIRLYFIIKEISIFDNSYLHLNTDISRLHVDICIKWV